MRGVLPAGPVRRLGSTGDMDGDELHQRRARDAMRQALVAIVAAIIAIGAISAVSGADDTDSRTDTAAAVSVVAPTVPAPDLPAPNLPATSAATSAGGSIVTVPLDSMPPTTVASAQNPAATAVADPGVAATPVGTATATAASVPDIQASAYAVYDVTADRWLAEREADTPMPVGSVMKLLTSYVVLQSGDLSKVVTVPKLDVDVSESAIGLYQGEEISRDVLLRAMLIVSANDAARTLAIDVGGTTDGFVEQMNAAAADLGLRNTVAANPIGLDAAGAHSSARDVIQLAALLMQNQTFREAVAKPSARLHGQIFQATNPLLTTYDGATGVKTGHTTQAGYCLVGSATRNGRSVIVAVLGAPTEAQRSAGAATLLDWAFAQA
jgi:D-alanyl-D-alanine carboxypeptidase (penicillin-binding protein 5/6)